ncbi:hypothetical protein EJB05_01685, partial [Eragrostis curvula]
MVIPAINGCGAMSYYSGAAVRANHPVITSRMKSTLSSGSSTKEDISLSATMAAWEAEWKAEEKARDIRWKARYSASIDELEAAHASIAAEYAAFQRYISIVMFLSGLNGDCRACSIAAGSRARFVRIKW